MNDYLARFAKNIGLLGILLSLAAGVARLLGHHHLLGMQAMTLLLGGMALMAASCTLRLNFPDRR